MAHALRGSFKQEQRRDIHLLLKRLHKVITLTGHSSSVCCLPVLRSLWALKAKELLVRCGVHKHLVFPNTTKLLSRQVES